MSLPREAPEPFIKAIDGITTPARLPQRPSSGGDQIITPPDIRDSLAQHIVEPKLRRKGRLTARAHPQDTSLDDGSNKDRFTRLGEAARRLLSMEKAANETGATISWGDKDAQAAAALRRELFPEQTTKQ